MSVSTVIYDREGLVGKIIINRPQKKNALDLETLRGLIEAFKQSAENDDLCVCNRARQQSPYQTNPLISLPYHINCLNLPPKS